MPLVSVIIPNYNHAQFLHQRIESILSQSFTDFELIILDDCSTDNSKEIIEKFRNHPKISQIVFNEKNKGIAAQWQKGINMASGDWIWIAESDDMAEDSFLEEFNAAKNRYPSAILIYFDSQILDNNSNRIIRMFSEKRNTAFHSTKWNTDYCQTGFREINESMKYDSVVNNMSAAIFRKDKAQQVLEQTCGMSYYIDWWFCLHLCMLGDICYIAKPLNIYRVHTGSFLNAAGSIVRSKTEYFNILKTLYYHPQVTEKKKLVRHFTFNYLSISLLKTKAWQTIAIIKSYFASDKKLASMVLPLIIGIRLSYRSYKKKYGLNNL